MKQKTELTIRERLGSGGKYVCCDNPNCQNAYHYMKEVSYNVLQQDREDGLIIDLSFCSLNCLLEVDPIKESLGVSVNEEQHE
ncbi:hypothetical protein [Enterococcus faecalis]|uniref:hypothetical protein n=1 Tax=Enterococcus faecalis TaxID=1351 RepID=UPI001571882B|nr:hypothetical protein [Enterococcus faecalis]MCU2272686.1 hypothetical protein [Enterococcus faecalis]NSN87980.1 hypothetical protein [Enterococcus faecalis]QVW74350.1 hypothetical protein I8F59_05015 [Enterococcus faecalis]UYY36711.1 hypothetical protein OLL95_04545 [Enterococcus faecalis]UYY39528.1 hypothetical protein OLL92_04540 [Enterococcus faecalis]